MTSPQPLIDARCIEINCPIWGWIKVRFDQLDFNWWQDCWDSGLEITVNCVCGQVHELRR